MLNCLLFFTFVVNSCKMHKCKHKNDQTSSITSLEITQSPQITQSPEITQTSLKDIFLPQTTNNLQCNNIVTVIEYTTITSYVDDIKTTSLPEFTTITTIETATSVPEFTLTPSQTSDSSVPSNIPIASGNSATLTYFTDSTTQCYGSNVPSGNAMAVNPLLLGFTEQDWLDKFRNVDSSKIPWCGKTMKVTINGNTFTGLIIDTCDPTGNPFPDPTTGQTIGGKCDYTDVIDLYGETGRIFLQNTVGDDFYKGNLQWEIIN